MKSEWNLNVEGNIYNIAFDKNKVFINGNKVKRLKTVKGSTVIEHGYELALGNQSAVLWVPSFRGENPVLTYNGINVLTGQGHELKKIPGWIYVFAVLYIIDFVVLLGGALGGALNFAMYAFTNKIAVDTKKSPATRVVLCTVFYIVVTVVELIIAMLLGSAIASIR